MLQALPVGMAVNGFEACMTAHYARMVRVLAATCGDVDAAEDAVQEAWARALARWRRVGVLDRPDAWVYVTALNVLRRRGRLRETDSDNVELPHESDAAEPAVNRVALGAALSSLGPRQRQVVVLRYLADLSTADVARALGCAEGTVKSTLHQALRALRVVLEDEDAVG